MADEDDNGARQRLDNGRLRSRLLWVLTAITGTVFLFWCYIPAIRGPLIFDDVITISALPRQTLPGLLFMDYGMRPLFLLTLHLNYWFTGDAAAPLRITNVCIHLLNGILLFLIIHSTGCLGKIPERIRDHAFGLAVATAFLWSFHPLLTQAVNPVDQRSEELAGMFLFVGLYLWIRSERYEGMKNHFWKLAGFAVLPLAMTSKETAIIFPVVYLFFTRAYLAESCRELWQRFRLFLLFVIGLPLLVVLVVLLRYGHQYFTEYLFSRHAGSPLSFLLSQTEVVPLYLRLALWPFGNPFCFDYLWAQNRPVSEYGLLPCGCAVLVIFVIAFYVRHPRFGFPLLFTLLTLLPRSSLIPSADLIQEHRMYVPLAGIILFGVLCVHLLLETLCERTGVSRKMTLATNCFLCTGLTLVLAFATRTRSMDYSSNYRLWQDTLRKAPDNFRAMNYFGIELGKRKEYRDAEALFRRVLVMNPVDIPAMINLANTLFETNRLPEAEFFYREAITRSRELSKWSAEELAGQAYKNLGILYGQTNRISDAIEQYRNALILFPGDSALQYETGRLLMEAGKPTEAESFFQAALDRDPAFLPAINDLGLLAIEQRKFKEAETRFREALSRNPEYPEARFNLAKLLMDQGQFDEALIHWEKLLMLCPGNKAVQEALEECRKKSRP